MEDNNKSEKKEVKVINLKQYSAKKRINKMVDNLTSLLKKR